MTKPSIAASEIRDAIKSRYGLVDKKKFPAVDDLPALIDSHPRVRELVETGQEMIAAVKSLAESRANTDLEIVGWRGVKTAVDNYRTALSAWLPRKDEHAK